MAEEERAEIAKRTCVMAGQFQNGGKGYKIMEAEHSLGEGGRVINTNKGTNKKEWTEADITKARSSATSIQKEFIRG